MSLIRKVNPVGVDIVIDDLQLLLFERLTALGWTDYESYPRAYKNEKRDALIPEHYFSEGDYKEVYFDDRLNASSFWLVDDSSEQDDDPNYTTVIKVIFQVKLDKLYPSITHRADEEMHKDISNILSESYSINGYQNKKTTGINKIYSEEGLKVTTGFEDIGDYHIVKFDIDVNYDYGCGAQLPPINTYVTVQNSDLTYRVTETNGGTLNLPDINFTDSDGVTTSIPSMKDVVATPCVVRAGIAYQRPLPTGLLISYAIGDDKWRVDNMPYPPNPPNPLYTQELVDFYTLKYPNEFGNYLRFTDINGNYTVESDNTKVPNTSYRYIIDNLTGLGINWQSTWKANSNNWNQSIDGCLSLDTLGFDDFYLPNINELASIVDFRGNLYGIQVAWSDGSRSLWASTTIFNNASLAYNNNTIYSSNPTSKNNNIGYYPIRIHF